MYSVTALPSKTY